MPDRRLDRNTQVGVLGAGAMGTGIAQVAAAAGHRVVIADARPEAVRDSRSAIHKALERATSKGRLTEQSAGAIENRLEFGALDHGEIPSLDWSIFANCGLVIEAIVEDLGTKREAFRSLEGIVRPDCVLATNTSSLSIAAIASVCRHPGRVIGLHFFNPATVLPLVEVVGSLTSDVAVVRGARELVDGWGKVTVVAADTPGFIVNRVARPFYGEALRLYEEGVSDVATIDWALREFGGFKMGPFELMDLIGNDVNYAVTRSVFEAMFYDPRYRPSVTQQRLVDAGRFGRKSGAGYYDYAVDAEKPSPNTDRGLGMEILDRVLAMLINEAADAVHFRIASVQDVDLAMTKGMNYPRGLLAWADEIGVAEVHRRLVALQEEYGEDRYRSSALLRRMAREGRRFYA